MQWGMVHDSVLAGRPGVNVEQVVCHFEDLPVDPGCMTRVWQAMSQRHPILRCVCDWRDVGEPQLRCLDALDVSVSVEDHRLLEASGRQDWTARWLHIDRDRGIDVQSAPTWRLTWLVWEDRHATLIWTFHHLFLDGPSFAALMQEALRDYLSQCGAPSPAAPESRAAMLYSDHARALAQRRADPQAQVAAGEFFARMLDGAPVLAGTTWSDALAPAWRGLQDTDSTRMHRADLRQAALAAQSVERLDALCRATGATLATALQAAWGLVLSRWSGRADVVFGVVRSGRHLIPGSQDTLGCLINTLPVRLSLRPGLSVAALLGEARQTMLGLRPHEHVALADVRQWCDLEPAADLLASTVLFEPQPFRQRMLAAGFDRLRFELHEHGASELSLMAYVDDGLDLRLEHDPSLIGEVAAQRLLDSVRDVLQTLSEASAETQVASLPLCTGAEAGLLQQWCFPSDPVGEVGLCVATRFEDRVRQAPTQVAVSVAAGSERLNCAELDARANRLANWMRGQGVGPGERVAICLSRSPSFVVAMLAVMKSGAAWVPVDPGYPSELVEHMVSDSQARLLLTCHSDRPSLSGPSVVLLDELDTELATMSPQATARGWPVDRPAYVIYTSGSTGKPKGVVVSHRALASHAEAVMACYGLQAQDRVLQFASLSFDVSIEEIVPTLLSGAELVLRHPAAAESVSALLQLVDERQLTVLNLPTAYWHTCVEQMSLSAATLPACVRLLVVGGEKASRSLLELWLGMHPSLRWINAYGPTEATISCTWYQPDTQAGLHNGQDVPIGRPYGHARTVVLAPDGSLAPPGARGELCIGGPCLADGYLGLPQATDERFVSTAHGLDPLLSRWGLTRLYRTGDEACWDDSGQLHYLGRHDRQVKVRGFRIELRAIEAALESQAVVSQAVVRVDRAGEPDARLLAWVLPQPGLAVTEKDLTASLSLSLPAYMRPAIQLVTEWPTTPGGKVDVRRLPAHRQVASVASTGSEVTDEVRRMMGVFAGVLKSDAVDAGASFFDLGGHSLLAVSLIGAIEREFGHTVTTGLLKAHPSPLALWTALREGLDTSAPKYLVPIQPHGQRMPLYAVHSLGHEERFFRPLSQRLGSEYPVYGLTTGYTQMHATHLRVEQTARLYFEDIQKHQPEGPLALAAVSMCAYVAFELAQQLTAAGREVDTLVLFDSDGPDGRPPLESRLQVLRVHWSQLQRRGLFYLSERAALRLTQAGGWRSRLGLALGRRLKITQAQHYDHPADFIFVERLQDAVRNYQPQAYAGRMQIFYPEDEAFFDIDEAKQTGLGWRRFCCGTIDLVSTPGQHISMLSEPHVAQLASGLAQVLSGRQPPAA